MADDDYRVVFHRHGGPEVLETERLAPPMPGDGEILLRHDAVGLNLIDTYHRAGLYPVSLPSGLGLEAAGIVEAVGDNCGSWRVGDRAAAFTAGLGAYATRRAVRADLAVRLPGDVPSDVAAALLLKGSTAEFLVERCARIEAGDTVLVHAAAGGVGLLLVSWLKAIGATVIAHAGTAAKAEKALSRGADHALSCPLGELADEVRALTGGTGVACVLDGVGAASWAASLASIARRGLIVSYGNASGVVPPVALAALAAAGSVFLTRPTLFDYVATTAELRASVARVLDLWRAGTLPVTIGARFPLAEAAEAHRAIEARRTIGSTLLIP